MLRSQKTAAHYLRQATTRLAHGLGPPPTRPTGPVFESGARWMRPHLALLRGRALPMPVPAPRFTRHGWLKYGLAMGGLLLGGGVAAWVSMWLLPVAVLGFYVVEVQFVFLFPLLLEGHARPLRASCRLTARVGLGRCLGVVLPVAGYMLLGLGRPRRALHHWHAGCLAILIWYVDETPAA